MNLSENLKRIRKENNLSQEQLAEELGVSRQSVSKWESGVSYPEMDKVLQIAKMFNLNIDDLLNQDIKEVNSEKQSKLAINKSIDDFLAFITKTIDMFSSMKFKGKIKCLFEQAIIIGVLTLIFLIIGAIGNSILTNVLSFLPWEVLYVIKSIFESLYLICALVLGFILLIHIFKTRYLDYYVIVKSNDSNEENALENLDEKTELKEDVKEKKIILEKKKEKVVIRDPKHSEYKFISGLLKCLLFIIKCIALVIALAFSVSLIGFVLAFILSFFIAKTGMFFIGLLLMLLSCILINIIILVLLFNFIMSKKSKKRMFLITFLSSLLIFGAGAGLGTIGFTKFDILKETNSNTFILDETTIPMQKDLIIDDNIYCSNYCKISYEEANIDNIKIAYKHSKNFELVPYYYNNYVYLNVNYNNANFLEFFREIIKDINNKKIINYANYEITIYASKENLVLLKQNQKNYYQEQADESNYISELEEQNSEYIDKICVLEEEISALKEELEKYKNNTNYNE